MSNFLSNYIPSKIFSIAVARPSKLRFFKLLFITLFLSNLQNMLMGEKSIAIEDQEAVIKVTYSRKQVPLHQMPNASLIVLQNRINTSQLIADIQNARQTRFFGEKKKGFRREKLNSQDKAMLANTNHSYVLIVPNKEVLRSNDIITVLVKNIGGDSSWSGDTSIATRVSITNNSMDYLKGHSREQILKAVEDNSSIPIQDQTKYVIKLGSFNLDNGEIRIGTENIYSDGMAISDQFARKMYRK